MAVSPDELIFILLLSLMLSTEQEEKTTIQQSSKVIFLWLSHIGKYLSLSLSSKFNVDRKTSIDIEMRCLSVFFDMQIDQLH